MIDASIASSSTVYSDPLKELTGGGANEKYVKNCTEIHLGNRGIEKLRGFERLVNLEVLFLNDNKLTHLTHLENNFRIKRLYLENNKLFTLKGSSVQAMQYLEFLDLTNNTLKDLQKVLSLLEHLKDLRELELKGNPVCEEPDYRYHVIHRLPSLHTLDCHLITDAERRIAEDKFGPRKEASKVYFMKRAIPKPPRVQHGDEWPVSTLESELRTKVQLLKDRDAKIQISEEEALMKAMEKMQEDKAKVEIHVTRVRDKFHSKRFDKSSPEDEPVEELDDSERAYLKELSSKPDHWTPIELDEKKFHKLELRKKDARPVTITHNVARV